MDYDNYSVYDFVVDASFKKAVKAPDSQEALFWEKWVADNPHKQELTDEARRIILLMEFEIHQLSKGSVDSLWEKVNQKIDGAANKPLKPTLMTWAFSNYRRVAAVFVGVLLFGFTLMLIVRTNATIEHVTGYGETKTLFLPDSSKVILNANSSLTYKTNWEKNRTREVRLQGEALFSVTSTKGNQKFIVSTQDLGVEVLGTEFNVNNRERGTTVVLNSGQIKLSIPQVETAKGSPKEIIMQPGELVEYSEEKKTITKKETDTEKYIAWSENKLVFEDTPLTEIIQILSDNYGLKIVANDNRLLSKSFTATYPADNIDILLKALSKSFEMKITKNEGILYLSPNNP